MGKMGFIGGIEFVNGRGAIWMYGGCNVSSFEENESNKIWKYWSNLSGYGRYANHSRFKNFSLSYRTQILIPFYNINTHETQDKNLYDQEDMPSYLPS